MLVTISKASQMAGVSRATIYNDIESGTLSIELGAKGRKMVDVSELTRVYKTLKNPDNSDSSKTVKTDKKREAKAPEQSNKVAVLQERLEAQKKHSELLEDMLAKEKEERLRERDASKEFEEYFKTQIENQSESIKNFTRLLEDQRGDTSDTNNDWEKSIKSLEDRIANQEKDAKKKSETEAKEKETIQKQLEEKEEALELEKHKSFLHKMLGR